ncbi:MAG: hypothetical protein KDD61_02545 [Bdellovibrionales bacterium]|nr:hypothetical protein [Bdellovibrionales bacterium]
MPKKILTARTLQSVVLLCCLSIAPLCFSKSLYTLRDEVQKIWQKKCIDCHNPNKKEQNFPISFQEKDLVESGRIHPGDAILSPLFQSVDSGDMPPKHPLSNPEIQLIEEYILSLDHGKAQIRTPQTYYQDVLPLFHKRCFSCHNRSAKGYKSLPQFDTYELAVQWSKAIKDSVQKRRMPPWNNFEGSECRENKETRFLNSKERLSILDWVDQGTKKGDPKAIPKRSPIKKVNIKTDIIAKMERPYTPPLTKTGDNYQCFILKIDHIDKTKPINPYLLIKGYEFTSTNPNLIHHALVWTFSSRRSDDANKIFQEFDNATPEDGWDCINDIFVVRKGIKRELVFGWVKGLTPKVLPKGTAIKIDNRNTVMVAQIHFNNTLIKGSNHTEVRMELAGRQENLNGLVWHSVGYHEEGSSMPARTSRVQKSEEGPLRVLLSEIASKKPIGQERKWAKVYGTLGHMHYYGKQVELSYKLGGKYKCLSCIDRWDVDWQESTYFKTPAILNLDDPFRVRCVFDTTRWHPAMGHVPTSPVIIGPLAKDEMCLMFMLLSYHQSKPH